MTTKPPTKAELAAELKRIQAENTALRELIAAASAAMKSAPLPKNSRDDEPARQRMRSVMIAVQVVCDPDGPWTWGWADGEAAARLHATAAEPLEYKPYEPCPARHPDTAEQCTRNVDHTADRDHKTADGTTWPEQARLAMCTAVDIDMNTYPDRPAGIRHVCELPEGHDGEHTAFGGPDHLPVYWWPREDLPSAAEARAVRDDATARRAGFADAAEMDASFAAVAEGPTPYAVHAVQNLRRSGDIPGI